MVAGGGGGMAQGARSSSKRALCGISATVNFSPQPRNDEKQSTSSSCSSFAGEPGALIAVVLVNFYTVTGHQVSPFLLLLFFPGFPSLPRPLLRFR